MLNIILFGPPGAGKGTQAALLRERYGLNHISTGEVIREEIRMRTPLGLSVQHHIERGELAPDELVVGLVADYVEREKDSRGNIFDGFPRTLVQAGEFDRIMAAHGCPVSGMISIDVAEDELVKRLMLRGLESGRADDVCEEVIRNRIEIYEQRTAPVEHHYAAQGKLHKVDGHGGIEETFRRLCGVIDELTVDS